MMARPIWKGQISFGLVSIPVAVYPAEKKEATLDFKMLDRRNMAPVGYKRVNKENGEEVPWGDIVKGFEYEEDKYVVLEEDDFKKANPKTTETIDILNFVEKTEIDPMFFEQPYYLGPLKNGEKGYVLLREALRRSGRVAIANVVLSHRQHIAAVMPHEDLLVMELLRYGFELRDAGALELPDSKIKTADVRENELKMAETLIEGMVDEWTPDKYHDEYRDEIMKMIEQKIKTGQVENVEETPEQAGGKGAQVVDMLSLLKASIEKTGKAKEKPAKASSEKKAPAKSQARGTTAEKKRKTA